MSDIERLEEQKELYLRQRRHARERGDGDAAEGYHNQAVAIQRAIDIVRQGGDSDE